MNTPNQVEEKITFESMQEAINKLGPPPKKQWIEVSKKGYRLLQKLLHEDKRVTGPFDNLAGMYGIQVYIRPYLKKLRIYTEK